MNKKYTPVDQNNELKVEEVAMLDFRHNADAVLKNIQKGASYVLTYRGKPVAKMLPIAASAIDGSGGGDEQDSLSRLVGISQELGSMSNEAMDGAIYG